jgi:hypothetical protein
MLFFQSGDSVAMTAAEPSGEMRAAVISVVLRNSSRVIAGFDDWAAVVASARQSEVASAGHRNWERISAIYLRTAAVESYEKGRTRVVSV